MKSRIGGILHPLGWLEWDKVKEAHGRPETEAEWRKRKELQSFQPVGGEEKTSGEAKECDGC
ncbi:hypothetical protein Ccrd_004645 [Cynara cardunculus var. scolymus]|uniref:Uncharacterized protein n=1 Tax=Cynara cardunculus var. scolymus TaxID=59895 RepID=A0A124SCC2_CYNCS|nr:hypothetical protein Ccrd_004645 [Cynara cardunculus var. scolymus]